LNYYLDLVGEGGLLKLTTGWCFADWVPKWDWRIPPMDGDGTSALFQWQFIWALRCAATVEASIGEPELALLYRRRAAELARAADVFWNEERGLFADNCQQKSFAEHTQAYVVLSGVLDADKKEKLRTSLCRDVKLTKATDAFAYYLYEAFFVLNLREKIVERLRACDEQEKIGLLTSPEGPEPTRSDCHGWSAIPHFHFFASLLGIRPEAPFFREVRIDPMWDRLGNIDSRTPHPDREIAVRLSLVEGKPLGEVTLPCGITGTLIYPSGELQLKEGKTLLK
jgi:alpha-L-rhamnosidase